MQASKGQAAKCTLIGAGFGALVGLTLRMWLIDEAWLFPGDTVVIGAILFAILGYWYGQSFLDFLREHRHQFF